MASNNIYNGNSNNHDEAPEENIESQEEIEVFQHYGIDFPQHVINDEVYLCPVDEREANRLDDLHDILTRELLEVSLDGLVIVPVRQDRAQILDCGFGTAAWTVAVARAHPGWNIIGVDIWGRMATEEVNNFPNIDLQIADLNDRFTFPRNSFDLVHSRLVAGGIASGRWPSYFKDIYNVLKPGCRFQMFEFYYNIQSSSGLLEGSACRRWSQGLAQCMADSANPMGRKDFRLCTNEYGRMVPRLLEEAGFQDIQNRYREIPISPWEQDERKRETGRRMDRQMRGTPEAIGLLRSLALYPMTERLGMHQIEFEALMGQASQELDDLRNKPYLRLYVYTARKPPVDPRIETLRQATRS